MSSPYDVQSRPAPEVDGGWTKDVFGEWHNPRYPQEFDPHNPPSKPGVNMVYNSLTNGAALSLGGKVLVEFSFAELYALLEQSADVLRDCQEENARLFNGKLRAIAREGDNYLLHGANYTGLEHVA